MRFLIISALLAMSLSCHAALPGLSDSIKNVIGTRNVGVAVISSNGDTIEVGERGAFELASVMKFHQAAALSRVVDFDTLIHKNIVVEKEDLRPDTWSPMRAKATVVPFETVPAELLDYTLNLSDNNAADILFDRLLSIEKTDSIIRNDYGVGDFSIRYNEKEMHSDPALSKNNYSTPLSAAGLIYRFFTADTTESATMIKAIMARESPFGKERIPSGMATSAAKVFHKTGTGFMSPDSTVTPVNDLAFVSYPTGSGYACYSLAVFTGGMHKEEAEKLIAEISRLVYEAVIINESRRMNAMTYVPAGNKPRAGSKAAEEKYTWGDLLFDTIFTVVDECLNNK